MRVDSYLWCIRYFKSRSLATQACKKGSVRIDQTIVKPSRDVFPGDLLLVRKNQITYHIVILDLPKRRLGAKLVSMYVKDTTPKENFEKLELLKYSKTYYRKRGVGRPTKKDRRDLADFTEGDDSESE